MKSKITLAVVFLIIGLGNNLTFGMEVWTGNTAGGESLIFRYDFDGNFLGEYLTSGGTSGGGAEIEAMVVIVPEPASLLLTFTGMLLLWQRAAFRQLPCRGLPNECC